MQKFITSKFKLLLPVLLLVLMQFTSYGQTPRGITGTVKDAMGESLPGASVIVKGSTTTTVTGADGSFQINAPSGSVLRVSFVGFVTQELKIGESLNYTIVLESGNILNDVVVLGYGSQRKRDVTGSTSNVSAEQIMQNPVMSPEQALQGRAPGVRVMQSNGAPGGAVQVQVRGVSSTGSSNQPLYVLDGIPLFDVGGQGTASAGSAGSPQSNLSSPLANINPNDIESMEILKDASATAIYGSRASNGVILITTKRGKAGRTSFGFDYYNGVQQLGKKIDMLNAVEGMQVRNTALLNVVSDFNRNIEPEAFNPYAFGNSPTFKSTDWQNELFRPAGIQDANLSASGGTDKFRYMVSGNYFGQEGIILNTKMDRISTRINLDVFASDKLKFGTSTALSYQNGNDVVTDNPFQGTVIGAVGQPAFAAAYNADGTYFGPLQNTPFWRSAERNGIFEAMEFTQNINRKRVTSNVFGEYEILKGFKFKSSLGIDYNLMDQRRRNPSIPRGPQLYIAGPDLPAGGLQRVSRVNRGGLNWVADQVLSYTTTLNDDHQLDGLIGFSAQKFTIDQLFARGDGSLNPLLNVIGNNLQSNYLASEALEESGLVSQFARFNYGFKGKYLVTGTVRRDGSSKFGPKNRYGTFPSVGLGWRVSDEPFFKKLSPIVNNFKVRASYGITGNQEIGQFAFISRIGGSNYTFGNTQAPGAGPINFANENLKWEENEQTDVGIDLGLLKGRIDISADYYVKNANDLLFGQGIPITSGFGGITGNLGKIQNRGFEFAISTRNTVGAFKWNTSFNISTQKNKVISLGDNLGTGINQLFGYGLSGFGDNPINVTREGLPMASFYGYVSDGLFQTQAETVGYPRWNNVIPQPGDLKIRDVNKDGVITLDDREVLGSPFPDYFGGLSNDFTYKNFSLNVFANFSVGNKIFNQQRLQFDQGGNFWGGTPNLTAWNGEGSSNEFPRLTLGAQSQMNRITADRWLEDGSFLRIRNITLGYNIPGKFINRYKMQNVRLYAGVSNAFTFTKYKGWDPEVNSSGSAVLSSGIDQTGYPVARTFQLGLNLGF
jgi:TonB-linked SusC/RagA family outer membrane protein